MNKAKAFGFLHLPSSKAYSKEVYFDIPVLRDKSVYTDKVCLVYQNPISDHQSVSLSNWSTTLDLNGHSHEVAYIIAVPPDIWLIASLEKFEGREITSHFIQKSLEKWVNKSKFARFAALKYPNRFSLLLDYGLSPSNQVLDLLNNKGCDIDKYKNLEARGFQLSQEGMESLSQLLVSSFFLNSEVLDLWEEIVGLSCWQHERSIVDFDFSLLPGQDYTSQVKKITKKINDIIKNKHHIENQITSDLESFSTVKENQVEPNLAEESHCEEISLEVSNELILAQLVNLQNKYEQEFVLRKESSLRIDDLLFKIKVKDTKLEEKISEIEELQKRISDLAENKNQLESSYSRLIEVKDSTRFNKLNEQGQLISLIEHLQKELEYYYLAYHEFKIDLDDNNKGSGLENKISLSLISRFLQ